MWWLLSRYELKIILFVADKYTMWGICLTMRKVLAPVAAYVTM